ncbi:type II toxin-antitoxin system VapC family toxin [Kytococcus sedentarius]|uniref:type II toxin-antitoxin system VapC family toxin n=1 Tax=Kytococcus sedentarius TaxID=1276 RepID=UPI0035BC1611
MRPAFIDSTVLLHAVGGDHPLRPGSRQYLDLATEGRVVLHASVEAGQEFLFHRMRRVHTVDAVREFGVIDRLVVWHPCDQEILRRSVALAASGTIGGRDAVHAATAIAAGFTEIVSADRDFDRVPGLVRRDPADLPA